MPDTLTDLPSRQDRSKIGVYALAAIVGLAVIVLALRVQTTPHMVPHVTVRNDTPFELTIVTSNSPEGSVTPLGIVPREATETFSDVIDQGRTWYFHVACSGVDAGTITRARESLVTAGWQIEVGVSAEARCRAAGLVPVDS
jgi:hypothetical protein